MEAPDAGGGNDVVHPEVRAHISSLVSALGGSSADDDGRYRLGDDALEVLRDIKKWIRFYDEKTNRMDVARCLAEANIVDGDLLHIIAAWPEAQTANPFKARIALACYELLTPLTWPFDRDPERTTINHYRHMPVLQLAQLAYKRSIINFDGAQILHTAVRVALPSMAVPIGDRSPRDQGIIKLVLYFLRNVAMIAPPPGTTYDGDESQISRSATVDAFSYQDIFLVLLTIASNMGEDFRTEDLVLMEIIFHLVKRVDISKLFMDSAALGKAKSDELAEAMRKEKALLQSHNRRAPTRHNRFGTMVWVKRADGRMSVVSGQDALRDSATRERKMDAAKTYRPPKRAAKPDMEPKDLGPPVTLTPGATKQLRGFVEEFLDSGFNPLFQHVRKTIDRDAPYLLHQHRAQFFYLVAWFLEAERARMKSAKQNKPSLPTPAQDDVSPFNLVAGVLNQEMFISLSRALDRSYNDKDWQELTTIMRCFTQILLTVQDMYHSGVEDDEEIAENMLARLFYEESMHDAVANIVRSYKDQGFEYLDACTELTHTYLRTLEAYSKQNVDMQVRSRKRTRRKNAAKKASAGGEAGAAAVADGNEGDLGDSADDAANAETISKERKFDFKKCVSRFVVQGVVDTFVHFARFHQDLNEAQLKRAHRYFYLVAFKQDMSVMLFRVDILHLLYNIVKGPDALDRNTCASFRDWEELVKQIIKKCVRKIEQRPALIVEMLFSKLNSTAHYLEYGFEKQTVSTAAKPGAGLEFKNPDLEPEQQVAIAVGALLDRNQADHITWVKKQLADAEGDRRAWELAEATLPSVEAVEDGDAAASAAVVDGSVEAAEKPPPKERSVTIVRPDHDGRRKAMFKNPYLRLLMKLVGFERLASTMDETPESLWTIPAHLSADQLKESIAHINAAEFNPPVFDSDQSAEQQLRRKSAAAAAERRRAKAAFDDDDDMDDMIDDGDEDNEFLFPAGGPTTRKVIDGEKTTKRNVRRRRAAEDGEGPTEEELDQRAMARREKEREKARRIKSDAMVHLSDDEDDPEADAEFFAREKERQIAREALYSRLERKDPSTSLVGEKAALKKTAILLSDDSSDDDNSGEGESDSEPVETSKSPAKAALRKRKQQSKARPKPSKRTSTAALLDDEDEDDAAESTLQEEDSPLAKKPLFKRRRRTAAFVDSSDSESEGDGGGGASAQQSASSQPSAAGPEDEDEDAMETDDTPLSPSPRDVGPPKSLEAGGAEAVVAVDEDNEDAPVAAAAAAKRRHRIKNGFVIDSSDED